MRKTIIGGSIGIIIMRNTTKSLPTTNPITMGPISIALNHIHTPSASPIWAYCITDIAKANGIPQWMTPAIIEKAIRCAYNNAHKAGSLQYGWKHGEWVVTQLYRGFWDGGAMEY